MRCKFNFLFVFLLIFSFIVNAQDWKTHVDSAKFYNDKRDYDKAVIHYTRAKELLKKDSASTKTYFNTVSALALAYAFKGDYRNGADFFSEAKDVAVVLFGRENNDYARVCNALANCYTNLGLYDKAEIVFIETRNIREKLFTKESADYAQVCNNLADLYRTTGALEKAEALAVEARSIRGRVLVKKHPQYAISCINLANVYRDMGQYAKAENLYIEAKNIREDTLTNQHPDYAAACEILAGLYYYMRQYNKAEPLYLEAKEIRKKVGKENYFYASSCNNLALLYRELGNFIKAEELALEAKEIWSRTLPEEHPSHPINDANLGSLYFAMGDYIKAEEYFLAAKNKWQTTLGNDHPYYTSNDNELAKVYWNLQENKKANDLFKQSIAKQYLQINKIFRFTNELEKHNYLNNLNGAEEVFHSFFYLQMPHHSAKQPYDLSLAGRQLILASSQELKIFINKQGDPVVQKKYDEWLRIKKQLALLYSKTNAGTEEIKLLEDRANTFEKELTRLSSEFKKQQQQVTWKEIHKNLKKGEAAIEFVEFTFFNGRQWTDTVFYIALVIRKDKPEPEMVKLFERRQLDSILNTKNTKENIAFIYTRGGGIVKKNTTKALYDLVWLPLEQKLKNITSVYYAPDGLLHRISFAALPLNKNQLLSDKYRLTQLNSTASLTERKKIYFTGSDKIILYGGVEYNLDSSGVKQVTAANTQAVTGKRSLPDDLVGNESWSYLPGTETEIKSIENLAKQKKYKITSYKNANASEESFKKIDQTRSPSILHIATHGFFFPDPSSVNSSGTAKSNNIFMQSNNPLLRSGLLLAGANYAWLGNATNDTEDGILTSYEVSNMYLPGTKLVVLSACETGLGDIQGSEGVYGLQRAFKMAGVQNLVMSLWKVPDAETAEFMKDFYKNIFNKQTIEDAFYNTQKKMKNKYRHDPYKWAAWIMVK